MSAQSMTREEFRSLSAPHRRAFKGICTVRGALMLHAIDVEPSRPTREKPSKRRRLQRSPKPGQRRAARRRDGAV